MPFYLFDFTEIYNKYNSYLYISRMDKLVVSFDKHLLFYAHTKIAHSVFPISVFNIRAECKKKGLFQLNFIRIMQK